MSSFPPTQVMHLGGPAWVRSRDDSKHILKRQTECGAFIVPQRVTDRLQLVNCTTCHRRREERITQEVARKLTG